MSTESSEGLRVLIIDDEPSDGFAGLLTDGDLTAYAKHPNDVTGDDVQSAGVIVVDQFLRNWRFDRDLPATMTPKGGLAVASVLRSQLEPNPTPIVVFTGGFDELGKHHPKAVRGPALADEYNVEWVVDRSDPNLPAIIKQLAMAVDGLPESWESRTPVDRGLVRWFGLAGKAWAQDALMDVEQCRPVVGGSAAHTSGAAFLRWFLQRVLPYPTCLLDAKRAAFRLGLTFSEFDDLSRSSTSELSQLLGDAQYEGQLEGFQGDRWWRAGLDAVLAGIEGWIRGELSSTKALSELAHRDLKALDPELDRLPVDGELRTLEPANRNDVAQIYPDTWPVYADDAYALLEDMEEDERLMSWRARAYD